MRWQAGQKGQTHKYKLSLLSGMTLSRTLCALVAAAAIGLGGCSSTDEKGQQDIYSVAQTVQHQRDWKKKSIAFVIDTSGSMDGTLKGKTKLDSAKDALLKILEQYKTHNDKNKDIEAALFRFNGDTVAQDVALGPFDYNQLTSAVKNLTPQAGTPLGVALAYAERTLANNGSGSKYIVMLTDGMSNVGRDPDTVLTSIVNENAKSGEITQFYIVAFNTSPQQFDGLKKQGATVYEAEDGDKLSKVLLQNTELILEAPDPPKK
jgi:Mg-chelatase subunit ChlD